MGTVDPALPGYAVDPIFAGLSLPKFLLDARPAAYARPREMGLSEIFELGLDVSGAAAWSAFKMPNTVEHSSLS